MSTLTQIQAGVDYIETRLDEPIDLAAVAMAASLSQWHFARIFKSVTGETVKAYIRARRMFRALHRLLATDLRVLDIAVMAGFESQEAFARAFKRAFGMAPSEFRRDGHRRMFVDKLRLDREFLRQLARNPPLEPRRIETPARIMVGMPTVFFGAESEKNNIGDHLPPLWDAFMPRIGEITQRIPGICYGVVRPDAEDPERLEYLAAMEVKDASAPVPPDMQQWIVPAATYAHFEHRGPSAQVDLTVSYAYGAWLMHESVRHTGGPDVEIYDDRWSPTSPDSVFEYSIPIV